MDHLPPRVAGAGRLSPAQSSAAATRPAPVQPGGRARHAGTCSPPRAGGAGGSDAGATRKGEGQEGKSRGRDLVNVREDILKNLKPPGS